MVCCGFPEGVSGYSRFVKGVNPKFFVVENVAGLITKNMRESFDFIIKTLEDLGYTVVHQLVNAADFGVPQDRKRVIVVGIKKEFYEKVFKFPSAITGKKTLRDALEGLGEPIATTSTQSQCDNAHEYLTVDVSPYSPHFLSRNKVRSSHGLT